MASNDMLKWIGTAVVVGLAIGVVMALVGRMLGLSTAIIGGVTGALVAVVIGQMKKRA